MKQSIFILYLMEFFEYNENNELKCFDENSFLNIVIDFSSYLKKNIGIISRRSPGTGQTPASSGAIGLRPHSVGDETQSHGAGVQVQAAQTACCRTGDLHQLRLYCRRARAKPKKTSNRPWKR